MRRSERREIRLSPEEEQAWSAAAKDLDMTFSDYVRRTVNHSLRDEASPVTLPAVQVWDLQQSEPLPMPPSEWPEKTEEIMSVKKAPAPGRPEEGDSPTDATTEGVQHPDPPGAFLTDTCTNAPFHVRGRYCNYCKRVIS